MKSIFVGGHFYSISQFTAGFIQSPNYPKPYPLNADCIWGLKAGINYTTTIRIYQFDVKPSISNICIDFVRISTYENSRTSNEAYYCGKTHPTYIYHQTRNIYIKFSSFISLDLNGYTGFRIGYSLCKYDMMGSVFKNI